MMLTTKMKEDQARYRKELMMAMRSLPSAEMLDLVAAGLKARSDYCDIDVAAFMREANDWSWGYASP